MDEYHRLIEAGTLGEDDHVQLIAGAVVAMTPQGPAHALVIQNLTRLVAQGLAADLALRPQLPLTLPDDSEPEPDLAVVRLADARSREHHPRTALLVVVPGEACAGTTRCARVAMGRSSRAGANDPASGCVQRDVRGRRLAADGMRLTVVELEEGALGAPPLARGHEGTPAAVTQPHVASHARRDVA